MSMRSLALAAVASLVAGSASAVDTVDLIWQSSVTPTITSPLASTTVLLDVVLDADTAGVSGISLSFQFDAAELQAIGLQEISPLTLPGMGNSFSPLAPGESLIDNTNGLIAGFDQTDLSGQGLVGAGGAVTLGSVKFHVLSAAGDAMDVDVTPGFFTGADGVVDSAGNAKPSAPTFTGAQVVPEPGALTLGTIAVATLAALRRQRRS